MVKSKRKTPSVQFSNYTHEHQNCSPYQAVIMASTDLKENPNTQLNACSYRCNFNYTRTLFFIIAMGHEECLATFWIYNFH